MVAEGEPRRGLMPGLTFAFCLGGSSVVGGHGRRCAFKAHYSYLGAEQMTIAEWSAHSESDVIP